jgi:hypothetical protein
MADRNSWALPGNGILSGMTLGAGTSEPNDNNAEYESPWALAVREAWEKQAAGDSDSSGYARPYQTSQPAGGGESIDSTEWPRLVPGAGFGRGQALWSPFPIPDSTSVLPPLQGAPRFPTAFPIMQIPTGANDRGFAFSRPNDWASSSTGSQSTSSTDFVPVSYQDEARPRPWPTPQDFVDFGPWAKQFAQGMQGLINFLRSYSSKSDDRKGEDECGKRYAEEQQNCYDRLWQMPHTDYLDGCLKRAQSRWLTCLRNGNPDGPGEVPEWGDKDEETWRNFGR